MHKLTSFISGRRISSRLLRRHCTSLPRTSRRTHHSNVSRRNDPPSHPICGRRCPSLRTAHGTLRSPRRISNLPRLTALNLRNLCHPRDFESGTFGTAIAFAYCAFERCGGHTHVERGKSKGRVHHSGNMFPLLELGGRGDQRWRYETQMLPSHPQPKQSRWLVE